MIKQMSSAARRLVRAVTIVSLCFIGSFTTISSAFGQAAAKDPWQVRFQIATGIGVDIDEGTKLDLTVGTEEILFEVPGEAGFLVPVAQVIELTYDNTVQSRANVWDFAVFPVYDPYWGLAPGVIDAMLVGTAWAVLSFFKSKDHFINLLWRDGETIKEVVFEAGKKEYVPVLQSLQNETGLQWKNLPEQRDTLRQELEGEKDNGISVELDRRVKLGPALLAPGLYQLVFLERELDRGELYFFAGKKVKPKEVVHAVAVDVVRPAEVVSEPEVIYEEANGVASIAEIHISVRIFRFRR